MASSPTLTQPHLHTSSLIPPYLLLLLLLLLLSTTDPAAAATCTSPKDKCIVDPAFPPAASQPNAPLAVISLAGRHLPATSTGRELVLSAASLALLDALQYARGGRRLTDATPDRDAARSVPWANFTGYAAYATIRAGMTDFLRLDDAAVAALDAEAASTGLNNVNVLARAGAPFAAAVFAKLTPSGPSFEYTPPNLPSSSSESPDCDILQNPDKWQPLAGQQSFRLASRFYNAPLFFNGFVGDANHLTSLPPPTRFNASTDAPYLRFKSRFGRQYLSTLRLTSTLGDYDKALAELFAPSPTFLVTRVLQAELAARRNLNARNAIVYIAGSVMAMYDAAAGTVTMKLRYSTARPSSVLACMIGPRRKRVTPVWGGPYRGVQASKGSSASKGDWRAFLGAADLPGYVSGHAAVATAGTLAFARMSGAATVGPNCVRLKKGGSGIEPRVRRGEAGFIAGVTDVANKGVSTVGYSPARDVNICWRRVRWLGNLVGRSRLFGGVHVPQDVYFGQVVGHRAAVEGVRYLRRMDVLFAHRPTW